MHAKGKSRIATAVDILMHQLGRELGVSLGLNAKMDISKRQTRAHGRGLKVGHVGRGRSRTRRNQRGTHQARLNRDRMGTVQNSVFCIDGGMQVVGLKSGRHELVVHVHRCRAFIPVIIVGAHVALKVRW
jgi:hypothetical protein